MNRKPYECYYRSVTIHQNAEQKFRAEKVTDFNGPHHKKVTLRVKSEDLTQQGNRVHQQLDSSSS